LMVVLSNETASNLMTRICSCCRRAKIRSNTPALLHRFIRVWMVCQLPKYLGKPRHLQPFSATYKRALSSFRFVMLTLPRWRGRQSAIRRYCSSVISIH
jgi:hypothetical protein